MITHAVMLPSSPQLGGKWGNYPRFRGDVDPAEPDPAVILDGAVSLNWCIRPSPHAWNIYAEGGFIAHYAVYFDNLHRFEHAAGHGHVFNARAMGRVAAKRAFMDHMLANPRSHSVLLATWLLPDQMFRPGWAGEL